MQNLFRNGYERQKIYFLWHLYSTKVEFCQLGHSEGGNKVWINKRPSYPKSNFGYYHFNDQESSATPSEYSSMAKMDSTIIILLYYIILNKQTNKKQNKKEKP